MRWILVLLLSAVFVACLALWSFQDPGHMEITWLGYEVQLSVIVGFFVLILALLILILGVRFCLWLFGAPLRWFSFLQKSRHMKVKHELRELLSSYEAENLNDALSHQKKGAKELSNDPFFLWISGNTFEKADKPFEAERCFIELTKNPSMAFLGFKGQIRAALHRNDFKSAYTLLRHAEKLAPASPWILKHLLALSREKKKYKDAEDLILRLEDLGYFSSDQSKKQIAYLHYQEAIQPETSVAQKEVLLKKSHHLDPSLRETTEILAQLLFNQGHKQYALNALEATWFLNPVQSLGDLYLELSNPKKDMDAYLIATKLVKNNSKVPESHLFLARTALKAKLWGEARTHLTTLIELEPTSEVYHLLSTLELEEHQNWKAAISWLEEGLKAPRHI